MSHTMEFPEILVFCAVFLAVAWAVWPASGKRIGSVKCRGGRTLRGARELQVQRTSARALGGARVVLRVGSSVLGSPLDLKDAASLAGILAWETERAPRGAVSDLFIDAADDGSNESRVEIAFCAENDAGEFTRFSYVDLDRSQAALLARLLLIAVSTGTSQDSKRPTP